LKISMKPESVRERVALAFNLVPRPLGESMLGPLLAKTLIAACALGVFDALGDSDKTIEEVAAYCGSDVTATGKLLRALYASGYLKWRNGLYGLTRISERWLVSQSPRSIHSAVLHRVLDLRFMDFEQYIRTGEHGDFHRELSQEDWDCYQLGQASQSLLLAGEVARRAPIPAGASDMLDLGGGAGHFSFALCERYPKLRSRVLDLVNPLPPDCTAAGFREVHGRVKFEVADVRSAQFGEECADAILVANVIHHFDERTNLTLFGRIADALRPGGILIVLDLTRPDYIGASRQVEALFDLYFGAASGAQLWSLAEIRRWQEVNGMLPLRAKSLRILPDCKIQAARKSVPL